MKDLTNIKIKELFIKEFSKDMFLLDELMQKHTSFKVGGLVDVLFLPNTIDDIIKALNLCKNNDIPYFIMGNGTNLLVKDEGYKGVIIKICKNFSSYRKEKDYISAQSGILLSKLAGIFLEEELEGFEFASGIPGTLGGAVCMNAGAYDGEMKDVVYFVKALDLDGNIFTFSNNEMEFSYRTSKVKKEKMIVLEVSFKLKKGLKKDIKEKMCDLNNRRISKQPLDKPSAGSTFKRPKGNFAGKLIRESGLKGYSVGGAQVSEKHCGFVINNGNATTKDIIELINYIKKVVEDKYNIVLEEEVIIL